MLIINGGMPRSGTVLVGNLIRLMLERRGIAWQRFNPQERRHLPRFLNLVQQPFNGAVIVHTHLIDGEILAALRKRPDAVLLWNHRDPRDALVSLKQLHELPLEKAIEAMQIYAHAAEIAHTSSGCLQIAYEELVEDLAGHIKTLATALKFELQNGEVEVLIEQTSPAAHAQIMHALSSGAKEDARQIPTKHRLLREDPTTLVNDRHIQSGKSGRWQHELSSQAQRQVSSALKRWIRLFGYHR